MCGDDRGVLPFTSDPEIVAGLVEEDAPRAHPRPSLDTVRDRVERQLPGVAEIDIAIHGRMPRRRLKRLDHPAGEPMFFEARRVAIGRLELQAVAEHDDVVVREHGHGPTKIPVAAVHQARVAVVDRDPLRRRARLRPDRAGRHQAC